jgi:tRNA(adenine34) deaminase
VAGPGPDRPAREAALLELAFREAETAASEGEVPVGAVLLMPSGELYSDHNRTAGSRQPSSHAEHLVISKASEELGDWRLEGSLLVCTLEPCLMCAGLCVVARVARVVFGAPDLRFGAFGSVTDVLRMEGLNHYPSVDGPVDPDRCGQLMREFFRGVR